MVNQELKGKVCTICRETQFVQLGHSCSNLGVVVSPSHNSSYSSSSGDRGWYEGEKTFACHTAPLDFFQDYETPRRRVGICIVSLWWRASGHSAHFAIAALPCGLLPFCASLLFLLPGASRYPFHQTYAADTGVLHPFYSTSLCVHTAFFLLQCLWELVGPVAYTWLIPNTAALGFLEDSILFIFQFFHILMLSYEPSLENSA